MSDISQVFEGADIFTLMRTITGLKSSLRTGFFDHYYILQYQLPV